MKMFLRGFFGPFFVLAFPVIMVILFGSIYGNAPSPLFGGRGSMDVSIPAYMALVVGVSGLMGLPLVISDYKDRKIYKRFDVTPVSKELILGVQFFINIATTAVGILLLILTGTLLYGLHIKGNPFAISGAVLLSALSLFSIGFFLTAFTNNAKTTNALCYILYFVMMFASGATLPKELFPDSVLLFSKALPLTYAVDLLQGAAEGGQISTLWTEICVLAGLTIVFGLASVLLYRRKAWD
jgi:ABC-2 type transport system permease protein